jgi:hypothetical protein
MAATTRPAAIVIVLMAIARMDNRSVKPGGPPRRALTVTWSEFHGPSAVSFAQAGPPIEKGPGD